MAASNTSRVITLMILLGGVFTLGSGLQSDIDCLKSIKESLDDPFDNLSTWEFSNCTEGFICIFRGVDCWHTDENKVQNLDLSGMGLKGEFPRGLANCSALTGVNFSSNSLYGSIPSDISKLVHFATVLDLSFNNISGEIPKSIANCSFLNALLLNNNQLTGQIPAEIGLLDRLKAFNVGNNLLSGPVPNFRNQVIVPSETYANNMGLCGQPLEPCKAEKKKLDKILLCSGFSVGWVLSTISVLVLNLIILPKLSAKKLKRKNKKKQKTTAPQGRVILTSNGRIEDSKIVALEKHVTRMKFEDLSQATNNFDCTNMIGMGKIGAMYKALLHNGWFLAVKKLQNLYDYDHQFLTELITLGTMRHNNLVPLMGFCYDINHKLLVYKFMSNGNLHDHLATDQKGKATSSSMEWPIRVKIAIGIAKGLAWLHRAGVVHGSICSRCILLDQNFEPKISNFGSAKVFNSNFTSSCLNVVVNSELWESGSFEKDAYDFGLVLLDLITGKEFVKAIDFPRSFEGDMVEWILGLLFQNPNPYDSDEIRLAFEDEILGFVRVAVECIQSDPGRRPSMLKVYKMLDKIIGRCELE